MTTIVPIPLRAPLLDPTGGLISFAWSQYFLAIQSISVASNKAFDNGVLDALSTLTGVGFVAQTGPTTFVETTIQSTSTIAVTNGNGVGTVSFNLAKSGVVPGSYGDSTDTPVLQIDEYGRITSAITVPITAAPQSVALIGDVTGSGNTGTSISTTLAAIDGVAVPPPSIGALTYDGTTLSWVSSTGSSTIVLGATFATNQPYRSVEGVAQPITSLDLSIPFCDGVTLESGSIGDTVPIANLQNQEYTTVLDLPGSDGDILFLGQIGLLTATVPSTGAGDIWSIPICRRVTSTSFVFACMPTIGL